jgi:hypothetical protein
MSKHRDIERKWMIEYMTPAVGCTIYEVGVTEDDEFGDAFPYLKIRRAATATAEAEEFTLEVSRDEEGNGPGHLFGLPSPGSSVTTIKLKNGMKVLAWDDAKPKRFSKADALKEVKQVRDKGHNAKIVRARPSGDHFISILEDDEEGRPA